MAELVEPLVHGEHFRAGDVSDLTRALEGLLRARERLASFYATGHSVRTCEDDARDHERLYERILARRSRPD
jgi:hypothetical protein